MSIMLNDLPPSPVPTHFPAPANDPKAATQDELRRLELRLWDELAHAADTRGHAWRHCALATVDEEGLPHVRTVVLREVDAAAHTLCFFTDARASKVNHLARQPRAALAMWSHALGWQLRLSLHCEVQQDGLAVSSRWARVRLTPAAHDYLAAHPPGSHLGPEVRLGDMPALVPHADRHTRDYFAVVSAQVLAIDWLSVSPGPPQRARFTPGEPARWLQP